MSNISDILSHCENACNSFNYSANDTPPYTKDWNDGNVYPVIYEKDNTVSCSNYPPHENGYQQSWASTYNVPLSHLYGDDLSVHKDSCNT